LTEVTLTEVTTLLRRPGLRWKLTAAIAVVSALVALALSTVVHNAARISMLNSARDVQDTRVQLAAKIYESTHRLTITARLNDPRLPTGLKDAARRGLRATYTTTSCGATTAPPRPSTSCCAANYARSTGG
jgi:hypothetical protein